MSQIKQLVDSTIADNDVVVFSKTYCPVSLDLSWGVLVMGCHETFRRRGMIGGY